MKKLLNLLLIIPVLVYGQGEQLYPDGTATDQDGNTFEWINYGAQDWAIENAEVVTYRDGTPIPQVTDGTEWSNLTTGAWCYYDNDPTKGKLYNWYAVAGIHDAASLTDTRFRKNFAPVDWNTPRYHDFIILENYLIENGYNYDGTTTDNKIAKAMASTSGWDTSTNVGAVGNNQSLNNRSGFNAFPGGYRHLQGHFLGEANNAFFHTSLGSPTGGYVDARALYSIISSFMSQTDHRQTGRSVRFVRNAQTASINNYSKPASIYPNPTSSIITIEGGAKYNIEVYSLQGRKLMTHRGNSIDLSTLSNAMYLIKATNTANMQQQIYKVIKE